MRNLIRTLTEWTVARLKRVDPILFLCTLILSCVSIVTVFGAVDNFGMSKLKMQVAMTFLGFIATVVIANFDYHLIVDRLWLFFILFSVGILGITLVFGSSGVNIETSNKSWLTVPVIGIAIQPSEFVKFTFICTFSKHLSLVRDRINYPKALLGLAAHASAIVGLILLSGDLGVALVYVGFILVMLFGAGLSVWYDIGLAAAGVAAFPYVYNQLLVPYQRNRIYYGFHPEEDPLDWGWQALFSRDTIINGGFFGRGIRGGWYYESLDASHTDFILATICEKFGFLGGTLVILTLMVLVLRLLQIARRNAGDYGSLICLGVAAVIVMQTAENVGMCFALVPVIGITLPFLSCGGSSLLATFMLVALAHSVSAEGRN